MNTFSIKKLTDLAQRDNPEAQFLLGKKYISNSGDESLAVSLYQKAADQGYDKAQCNLGCCYERGIGITKNSERAITLYQKAADQGLAEALYNLGLYSECGLVTEKNLEQAATYYKKAAKQGLPQAQCRLGFLYMQGLGVTKDEAMAARLYLNASKKGYVPALHYLGLIHEHGIGTNSNAKKATQLYAKYIKNNDPKTECSICLSLLLERQQKKLSCECNGQHIFHTECLNQWKDSCIEHNDAISCPLCRETLIQ
jgi:TPR repeat protein